jgi:hypothetical protein
LLFSAAVSAAVAGAPRPRDSCFERARLQATPRATNVSTVHVQGTIIQCGKPVPNLWVTFEGKSPKTVKANAAGTYEADLPLGVWTATTTLAPLPGTTEERALSHPHPFRVAAPKSVVLNVHLRPPVMCDLHIMTPDRRPPAQQEIDARDTACYGEKFFLLPSADGVPFEVDLGGLDESREPCSISGPNTAARQFASYNLLSVEADTVTYDPDQHILAANGDVVIDDESGTHRAHSVAFRIEEGRATPVRQNR